MFGIPVPKERELRFIDIQTIAKFIDDGWEKTLVLICRGTIIERFGNTNFGAFIVMNYII